MKILMSDQSLLKFPCRFDIKIMGLNHIDLIPEVTAIIARHVSEFNPDTDIATKFSKQKNYLAITASINAVSQEQLDTIYQTLNQHDLVKVTL